MCGICGSVALGAVPVDAAPVRAMLRRLVHRGPDAEGLLEAPGLVAGIRRLAVIDVAGGDQPIASEDGAVEVVLNGEIYNFEELRRELEARGHRFRTRSDTEVLVHLWEDDGPTLVDRLNGMFAFCVHDRRTRETFLARDHLGVKPLYWAIAGERLVFASEPAALIAHPGVPREIDFDALVELFCLQFVSGAGTIWRGVRKLLPGHAIHVRDGRMELRRHYEVPAPAPRVGLTLEAACTELRELLESAVRYQKVADVPLGTFLSGGIDSTLVTGILADLVADPVQAFSVGFDGEAAYDERDFAREAAARYGADHHELVVSAIEIAEHLPRLVAHSAEPVTDPALIPTYLLSRFARERVTVVLTGEGADELFGGYRRYLYQSRYGWLKSLPGVKQAGHGMLRGLLPARIEQALSAMTEDDPARGHLEWAAVVGSRLAAGLFERPRFASYARRVSEHFAGYFEGPGTRLAGQLRADQSEWLPHDLLAKVDRASMACSLEARVPFLDRRIVDWAAGLPDELRIHGGVTKHVLRETYRDLLPPRILERPKRGFDLPLAAWIRGPLRPLAEDQLAGRRLSSWEGLNVSAVREMLQKHLAEEQDFGLPLFNLLSVMLFLEEMG